MPGRMRPPLPDPAPFTMVGVVPDNRTPKRMTLLVEVEANKALIEEFAANVRRAQGELTELGFAFRELCACASSGRVRLATKSETYTPLDFAT